MRIDELHKFSDGTLNDVRSALDDILKRIRIEYLPQTVWRNVDRERAGAMIQAIDRQLRNRRLMRSLEKFRQGYKAVKHRYSNPMIQPELEGSTQGYPLDSVEVLRYDTKGEKSDTQVITMKMEILLEPTSNKLMVGQSSRIRRILKDGGEGTWFHLSHRFMATCSYPIDKYKDIMKAQVHVSRIRYSDIERLS
ncbi:hypothetical protein Tco_0819920 [Tanacetum coccineum]|uniref:Uncharacterized protein n=1 Tax=Tanacetum coccineum TaxID=301880 RepID=A0ABQ5A8U8_9ASTR